MKKSILSVILCIFFFFPFFSFAQSNYKPGYVVGLKNDTLKGYIDYREWRNNPKSVNFKVNLNDKEAQKFGLKNAIGFGVTNLEYYQKYIVQVSNGSVETGSLPAAIDSSYVVDTVFLKVITTGKNVSLYTLSEPAKTHYYIKDNKDNQVNELNYYAYLNNGSIVTVYTFRKQLLSYVFTYKPDSKLIEQARGVEYGETDIKAIVNRINGGEDNRFKHEKLSDIRFFAGAGIKSNTLTFKGADAPFPDGTNRSDISPAITGGVDFITNKNTNKLILRAEVMVTDNQYNFSSTGISGLITNSSLALKQLNFSVVPQLIYNIYSGNSIKLFFDAGVGFNFSFYNNYNYIADYFDQTVSIQNKYPELDKAWLSFPLKAGLAIGNKIEIYGNYWFSSALTSNINYSASLSSYAVGINYKF